MYNDKVTKSVADAVRQVVEQREPEMLNEALKGNQHKIDVNKNKKIDAHDFKLLRAGKKVEESAGVSKKKEEKFHMSLDKLVHKTFGHSPAEKMKKEGYKLNEDHFKVGDEVVCKASGMEGEIVKVDPEGEGKYYTVKREDGKTMKYAPEDLKLEKEDDEDEKEDDEKEMKESVEQLKEYESKGGVYKHQGSYGKAKGSEYGGTDWDKEETEKEEKPKRKKYGARQNFVRSKRVNEGFTDLLTQYTEGGIKSLFESLNTEVELVEEPSNDEYKAELEKTKAKAAGTVKADVAKAKVIATDEVKESLDDFSVEELEEFMMSEQFQQLDELSKSTLKSYIKKSKEDRDERRDEADSARATGDYATHKRQSAKAVKRVYGEISAEKRLNKEEIEQIEERELSDAEMQKRERYVKSMKKNLAGFKERYGKRGKEVMYATATKMAKED